MAGLLQNALKLIKPRKYNSKTILKEGSVFEVDCWALSELLLEKVIPKIGIRPYPLNEQMLMAAAVAFVQPRLIIEWGTHLGKSARLFWEVKKALGLECKIHTIDSMEPEHPEFPGGARGKYLSGIDVDQIIGDGATIARNLIEGSTEPLLVYIDGDHSRESTKQDFTIWDKLPSGSGLLTHDVLYQTPSSYNIGPWQSLQELLRTQESSIAQTQWQLLGLPGMAFVGKK